MGIFYCRVCSNIANLVLFQDEHESSPEPVEQQNADNDEDDAALDPTQSESNATVRSYFRYFVIKLGI